MKFYKYQGAGNDFLIADARSGDLELDSGTVRWLCDRHLGFGADGVMVLEEGSSTDFRMRYYNPDGSTGMMCGNGGRCIVAFAYDLGFRSFRFEAPDGIHEANVLSSGDPFSRVSKIVKLRMRDIDAVCRISRSDSGIPDWFIDTGARHFVRFVDRFEGFDVIGQGRGLRYDPRFAPEGVNVDFVCPVSEREIRVRTYEKGVEDETLACGTGIVASALASYVASSDYSVGQPAIFPSPGMSIDSVSSLRAVTFQNKELSHGAGSLSCGQPLFRQHDSKPSMPEIIEYTVHASIADLRVSFRPHREDDRFKADNVFLTGPTTFVGLVETM